MSLRDQILNAVDNNLKDVNVPEWNTSVYLKALSVADRRAVFAKAGQDANKPDLSTWMVLYSVCDEHGKRLFQEKDFGALAAKNAAVVDRLALEAFKHNRMDEGEQGND